MDKIILVLMFLLVLILIQVYRNNRLNQSILNKQKQLNEVNIEIGHSIFNQRTITMAISSLAVVFVLVSQAPDIMNEFSPMEAVTDNYMKNGDVDREVEHSSLDNALCISGKAKEYKQNLLSVVSAGSDDVDYIFLITTSTRGTDLLKDIYDGKRIGVFVKSIKESYPMQGNAIEIVEECK